jgi:hypothetical protein
LNAVESRNSATAPAGRNASFDDDLYDVIGSGVKEAPELYSDTCSNAEQTYI